jgi:hypothetical protein
MFDHSLATDFAKSCLSLVDTGGKTLRERAALALAALASTGERSLESLVGHHQVGAYTHRNPDGSRAVVVRNPWVVIESDVHFEGFTRLKKWKEIRSGARIGRGVNFGDYATIGQGVLIGDGVGFDDHTIVPDGFVVTSAAPRTAPAHRANGMIASVVKLLGSPVAKPRTAPREVRVQCALDLVDLVVEEMDEKMSDGEIVDIAYAAANAYFLRNTGFVVQPEDIEDYTVFSRSLVRHVNPDGTKAVVTKSAFGGLGPDVSVDGHAYVGQWAWVEGNSFIGRGASTQAHIAGRNVYIETPISREVDTSDLQAILRLPFLTTIDLGQGIEIPPERAEISDRLVVVAPKVDDHGWEWGEDGPMRPRRKPPFFVGPATVTDEDGIYVDVSLNRDSGEDEDHYGYDFAGEADDFASIRP